MKYRTIPMKDVSVVSDIHGHYNELVKLMECS